MVVDHHWLLDCIDKDALVKRRKKVANDPGDADAEDGYSEDGVGDEDLLVEVVDNVFEKLDVARAESSAVSDDEHFEIRPLGGEWTAKNLGVAFDLTVGKHEQSYLVQKSFVSFFVYRPRLVSMSHYMDTRAA